MVVEATQHAPLASWRNVSSSLTQLSWGCVGFVGGEVSFSAFAVRLQGDHFAKEELMQYVMLIGQADVRARQAALPEEEQKQVYADYRAINEDPRVTGGVPMGLPENATTVRIEDGNTLTTDGPFVAVKEALGGDSVLEVDDLDAAIELAGGSRRLVSVVRSKSGRARLIGKALEQVFREERGRVLADLIGFFGHFDLAEEAAQEAFALAAERWPGDGPPANRAPASGDGANRAIDHIRLERTLAAKTPLLDSASKCGGRRGRDDDPRRAARAALHLLSPGARPRRPGRGRRSTLGSLSTGEIARAFLVPEQTMAKRLLRAKRKIKASRIPFRLRPPPAP